MVLHFLLLSFFCFVRSHFFSIGFVLRSFLSVVWVFRIGERCSSGNDAAYMHTLKQRKEQMCSGENEMEWKRKKNSYAHKHQPIFCVQAWYIRCVCTFYVFFFLAGTFCITRMSTTKGNLKFKKNILLMLSYIRQFPLSWTWNIHICAIR